MDKASVYYQQVKLLIRMLLKRGEPYWALFDEMSVSELPAIRWKLINIQKLRKDEEKHREQLAKLEKVLEQWLT